MGKNKKKGNKKKTVANEPGNAAPPTNQDKEKSWSPRNDEKEEKKEETKVAQVDLSDEKSKRPANVDTKKPRPKLKRKGSKFDIMGEASSPLLRPEFVYGEDQGANDKIWSLMKTYQGTDRKSIQRSIVNHVEYTLAMTRFNFTNFGCYQATVLSLRDRLLESWNDTNQYFTTNNIKRVYYLSLEFLLGRLMQNTLNNIDMEPQYKDALMDIGYQLEDLYDQEVDPALGNGGLGRLAA